MLPEQIARSLEPDAANFCNDDTAVLASIAISLKRIADALSAQSAQGAQSETLPIRRNPGEN